MAANWDPYRESSDDDQAVGGSDSESESPQCPICLASFGSQDVGTPESCDHSFCLDCIQEWAKNVNTCPIDRHPFNLIFARSSVGGPIYAQIHVDNNALPSAEDPTFCEVCGQSDREDRLLLCDGCDSGYHLECLNPPLMTVPVEEWFCPECVPIRQQGRLSGSQAVAGAASAAAGPSRRELPASILSPPHSRTSSSTAHRDGSRVPAAAAATAAAGHARIPLTVGNRRVLERVRGRLQWSPEQDEASDHWGADFYEDVDVEAFDEDEEEGDDEGDDDDEDDDEYDDEDADAVQLDTVTSSYDDDNFPWDEPSTSSAAAAASASAIRLKAPARRGGSSTKSRGKGKALAKKRKPPTKGKSSLKRSGRGRGGRPRGGSRGARGLSGRPPAGGGRRRRKGKQLRKRHKGRQTTTDSAAVGSAAARMAGPATAKGRLAGRLGLMAPPSGQTIPLIRRSSVVLRPLEREELRQHFSVFGHTNDLSPFDCDLDGDSSSSAVASYQHSRASADTLFACGGGSASRASRRPASAAAGSAADLLGSILEGQRLLGERVGNIHIDRDGSLRLRQEDSLRPSSEAPVAPGALAAVAEARAQATRDTLQPTVKTEQPAPDAQEPRFGGSADKIGTPEAREDGGLTTPRGRQGSSGQPAVAAERSGNSRELPPRAALPSVAVAAAVDSPGKAAADDTKAMAAASAQRAIASSRGVAGARDPSAEAASLSTVGAAAAICGKVISTGAALQSDGGSSAAAAFETVCPGKPAHEPRPVAATVVRQPSNLPRPLQLGREGAGENAPTKMTNAKGAATASSSSSSGAVKVSAVDRMHAAKGRSEGAAAASWRHFGRRPACRVEEHGFPNNFGQWQGSDRTYWGNTFLPMAAVRLAGAAAWPAPAVNCGRGAAAWTRRVPQLPPTEHDDQVTYLGAGASTAFQLPVRTLEHCIGPGSTAADPEGWPSRSAAAAPPLQQQQLAGGPRGSRVRRGPRTPSPPPPSPADDSPPAHWRPPCRDGGGISVSPDRGLCLESLVADDAPHFLPKRPRVTRWSPSDRSPRDSYDGSGLLPTPPIPPRNEWEVLLESFGPTAVELPPTARQQWRLGGPQRFIGSGVGLRWLASGEAVAAATSLAEQTAGVDSAVRWRAQRRRDAGEAPVSRRKQLRLPSDVFCDRLPYGYPRQGEFDQPVEEEDVDERAEQQKRSPVADLYCPRRLDSDRLPLARSAIAQIDGRLGPAHGGSPCVSPPSWPQPEAASLPRGRSRRGAGDVHSQGSPPSKHLPRGSSHGEEKGEQPRSASNDGCSGQRWRHDHRSREWEKESNSVAAAGTACALARTPGEPAAIVGGGCRPSHDDGSVNDGSSCRQLPMLVPSFDRGTSPLIAASIGAAADSRTGLKHRRVAAADSTTAAAAIAAAAAAPAVESAAEASIGSFATAAAGHGSRPQGLATVAVAERAAAADSNKKVERQQLIAAAVNNCLAAPYDSGRITKAEHKDIQRKAVNKIYQSKSKDKNNSDWELDLARIQAFVDRYVDKVVAQRRLCCDRSLLL